VARNSITTEVQFRFRCYRTPLSRSGDPGAEEAQAAVAEVAACLVQLEEALQSMLAGTPQAAEKARQVLADG